MPTTTFLAPSALSRPLALADSGTDRFARLRLLVHAGSPCPPALKRAALEVVPVGTLWEFYGSTEGQFTVCSPEEWIDRPGTVGRARAGRSLDRRPGWHRVVPTAGFRPLRLLAGRAQDGGGVAGRVVHGGRPRAGRQRRVPLPGRRRDDLVITGGVNVYPAEVEAALAEVSGVREVAVFGLPDERWGQRVVAAVVTTAGAGDEDVVAAMGAHAAVHLAGYKRPKEYRVVGALPARPPARSAGCRWPNWCPLLNDRRMIALGDRRYWTP